MYIQWQRARTLPLERTYGSARSPETTDRADGLERRPRAQGHAGCVCQAGNGRHCHARGAGRYGVVRPYPWPGAPAWGLVPARDGSARRLLSSLVSSPGPVRLSIGRAGRRGRACTPPRLRAPSPTRRVNPAALLRGRDEGLCCHVLSSPARPWPVVPSPHPRAAAQAQACRVATSSAAPARCAARLSDPSPFGSRGTGHGSVSGLRSPPPTPRFGAPCMVAIARQRQGLSSLASGSRATHIR